MNDNSFLTINIEQNKLIGGEGKLNKKKYYYVRSVDNFGAKIHTINKNALALVSMGRRAVLSQFDPSYNGSLLSRPTRGCELTPPKSVFLAGKFKFTFFWQFSYTMINNTTEKNHFYYISSFD